MKVDGKSFAVAAYSGKYSQELCAVYAKEAAKVCGNTVRQDYAGKETELHALAQRSKISKAAAPVTVSLQASTTGEFLHPGAAAGAQSSVFRDFLILPGNKVLALDEESEPLPLGPLQHMIGVTDPHVESWDETESRRLDEARRKAHEASILSWNAHWKSVGSRKEWDTIISPREVYDHCGAELKEDPRLNNTYKEGVLAKLGLNKVGLEKANTALKAARSELSSADFAAVAEVIGRKISAFWLEGSPRTTLRYLMHDTIPTGPPVRTPPHKLKGEEAEWVDKQLQAEVDSGQLERGNSEWASPPFATKEFAEHRRQRKRRVVVDYRRVNRRTLRAVYCVRSADGVTREVAGSAWMTFLDACKGFNQVKNTERARRMLAILARSGQFLPRCLTFGPHNGPEDFAYATDRVYAPGRGRRMRFCKEWQIYADDCTIRTGRVCDGVVYTDAEWGDRLQAAYHKRDHSLQHLGEAFVALGFDPAGLGGEATASTKERRKTKQEEAKKGLGKAAKSDPSPRAHVARALNSWLGMFVFVGITCCIQVDAHSLPRPADHISHTRFQASYIVTPSCVVVHTPGAMSWGGYHGRSKRWDDRSHDRRPFAEGRTAMQLFSGANYRRLKEALSWRLDKWPREKVY
jgi:hypothetical protein